MKFDTLHCALLVIVVLLAVYVARGYGLFKEGLNGAPASSCIQRCVDGGVEYTQCRTECSDYGDED